tara:strand:+ start:628 stop:855 length:228 start_codon:yes stop_codon:yes gene_type:complete
MPTVQESLEALEITVQDAVVTVESAKTALDLTEAGIEARIAAAVEEAENESVLALIKMSENSVKTQTLFLTYINQ